MLGGLQGLGMPGCCMIEGRYAETITQFTEHFAFNIKTVNSSSNSYLLFQLRE
jgi:hypothetical protein